jgi:hypothetical protein
VSGSEKAFDASGVVDLEFLDPSTGAARTDFVVKVGYDSSGNAQLDASEFAILGVLDGTGTDIGEPTIRGINEARYSDDSDRVDDMIDTGIMDDVLGVLVPHATKCMVRIFRDGIDTFVPTNMQATGIDLVTLDAFQDATTSSSCFSEWLSHNSGASFNNTGVTSTLKEFYWDASTSLAELLGWAAPITPLFGPFTNLRNFYDTTVGPAAVAYFQANPDESFVWLPSDTTFYTNPATELIDQDPARKEPSGTWVPTETVNVWRDPFASYADDAKASMGRGRLIRIKRQFRFFRQTDPFSGIASAACTHIRCVGELQDLYDWNSEDIGADGNAAACATLQIGSGNGTFGGGRNKGLIYRVKVDIDEVIPLGMDPTRFPDQPIPPVP